MGAERLAGFLRDHHLYCTARDGRFYNAVSLLLSQAAEIAALRAEVERKDRLIGCALSCTPMVRDDEVIYDCGDPGEMLRDALTPPKGSQSSPR